MNLLQWSYTKRYQVKAIFDKFPDQVFVFRTIGSYYFVFTTKGSPMHVYPTREDYVAMELLINEELDLLPHYLTRRNSKEDTYINSWLENTKRTSSVLHPKS
ncbi:hypothetical protein [Paenisporosarcina cavernae]|uniref:Uncharacterized protein n=1 Tax=Paenisporosarcina cavernae TaxID=2320858 RepID=A0A385YRS3_9BACL|nr:hypothetical protein [Paenisporosarcina cavernae]AYC29475.1 hypothetical protein D3873_06100 [Paenisporosarcina cavernae]